MKNAKLIFIAILFIASFLRLYKLSEVPVSLFGDELDVGYHAYSILKTGKDYSGNFMPLHFQSLAEWRTPLYLYSAVPTVAVWGISPLGVRLPAALFGILSIIGFYLLTKILLKNESDKNFSEIVGLLGAFILAINPWHIQYSRAAFEVTELLAFLLFGLYFFFKSQKNKGKGLWISVLLLTATPLIYSTAKLFTPIVMVILCALYWKDIVGFTKKNLFIAVIAGLIVGLPTIYGTLYSGGTQRFNYISVFSDPTIEPEVGTSRITDALARGELVAGLRPSTEDRAYHNKLVFWADRITTNYLMSFSTDFLFNEGDPNLRHSIKGVGQFFKIEIVALFLGIVYFWAGRDNWKIKTLLLLWIVFAAFPSAITRDGGNHATRLIIMLPPLVFLMSYGLASLFVNKKKYISYSILSVYAITLLLNFVYYQHSYWVHNPMDSERWWHSGWKESIQTIKDEDKNFDRVIISMDGEPAWIFFAAWYQYDPIKWHQGFPMKGDSLPGFGEHSFIDKFHFASFHPPSGGIYDLPKYIDSKTLYLANAKEIGANLIQEPERVPNGLQLIKAVPFPSGEPAFYLFTKQ